MAPIIETQKLTFARRIVYPDLSLERGTFTFLKGPSGCGKTTLFRLFNGSLTPNQGSVFYKGQNIEEIDPLQLRRDILLVPQEPFLFPGTVEDNFQKYYEYLEEPLPPVNRMEEMLTLVGNEKSWTCETQTLSGGERRRIFLAVFLTRNPQVLLLDEPTGEMDGPLARRFFDNIKDYANQKHLTVLVICHQEEWIKAYGDRVISLKVPLESRNSKEESFLDRKVGE